MLLDLHQKMEGSENIAMDLVIGYRGFLGGTFVAFFSHLLTTDRSLKGAKWWRKGLRTNWPILVLTPGFMIGVRRLSNYFEQNTGGSESENYKN